MELGRQHRNLSPLTRKILWADAGLEAVVGLALLGIVGNPDSWLNVDRSVTLIAAAVFGLATIALVVAALWGGTNPSFVQQLAFANVAGGVAVWVLALAHWDSLQTEGRWLVAAVGDAFILVGLLEFLALRKTPPAD